MTDGEDECVIVTIAYKSGECFQGRFASFTVERGTWKWDCRPNEAYPDTPLVMGVDEISAVWYRQECHG